MSLSKLKESSDQLSLKLSQSITENEQRFSEIERDIEKIKKNILINMIRLKSLWRVLSNQFKMPILKSMMKLTCF